MLVPNPQKSAGTSFRGTNPCFTETFPLADTSRIKTALSESHSIVGLDSSQSWTETLPVSTPTSISCFSFSKRSDWSGGGAFTCVDLLILNQTCSRAGYVSRVSHSAS